MAGKFCEICKTQGSSRRFKLFCGTRVSTLMRPFEMPAFSSSPSTISRLNLLRTCLNCAAVGRSGRTAKREDPALAIKRPSSAHNTASLASICVRTRSNAIAALASCTSTNCCEATRDCLAKSAVNVSKVTRPKLRPATKAPSTLTSNQLSMERETNW